MTHEQAFRLLPSYYDHELDEASAREVAAHCSQCSACAGTLATWVQLRAVIHDAAVADLGLGFVEELRESVLNDRDSSGEWMVVEPLARRTVFAMAVAVALLTSIFWSSGEEVTTQLAKTVVLVAADSTGGLESLRSHEFTKDDVLLATLGE